MQEYWWIGGGFIAVILSLIATIYKTGKYAQGFPGTWANMGASANCVSYLDLGAVQRIEPTGGGSGWSFTFVH